MARWPSASITLSLIEGCVRIYRSDFIEMRLLCNTLCDDEVVIDNSASEFLYSIVLFDTTRSQQF